MKNLSKKTRIEKIKDALRKPYTWPGCYPISFIADDGPICPKCVRSNFKAVINDCRTGGPWKLTVEVLWEGTYNCTDCEAEIETAYGPIAHD